MSKAVLNEMPSQQHCITFSRRKIKKKIIELMAVCKELIICYTLISLLIFDFLNVIRKLRDIFLCDVRILL